MKKESRNQDLSGFIEAAETPMCLGSAAIAIVPHAGIAAVPGDSGIGGGDTPV